jgi:hypothetical protein
MPRSALAFITLVCAVAAISTTWLVSTLGWSSGVPESEAIALMALALVAELLAEKLPAGGFGSVAFVPFIAALMISPTSATVLLAVAASASAYMIKRREAVRVAFNAAQGALGFSLALTVFFAFGGRPLEGLEAADFSTAILQYLLPGFALTAVLVATNTLLVCTVVALTTKKSPVAVIRANSLVTLGHLLVAVPATFGIAWIALKSQVLGVAVLSVPLLGIRGLYKTSYDLQKVNSELLELMIKAIEARDPYTSGHSRRVSANSRKIAEALRLSPQQVDQISVAALLHDVGKIHESFAPILLKPGRLSDEEWAIMKTHPSLGADLVATISHLRHAVPNVRGHHEHWDGTGYPDGLAGERIPLGARIVTVADTIDALTTNRPYRQALTAIEVRSELVRCRGTQFDPAVCDAVLTSETWRQIFPEDEDVRPTVLRIGGLRRASTWS